MNKEEEEAKRKVEEAQIQYEAIQKEYSKLDKTDKRFIGIDLDSREYWICGHGWKINQLGFSNKKKVADYFNDHDAMVEKHDKLDAAENARERLLIVGQMLKKRDEMIQDCTPLMLSELDGKKFQEKWFDTNDIPAAAWWDCIRDVFLFLRGSGSREDILLSMMLSNSESQTTSTSTKTQKKST